MNFSLFFVLLFVVSVFSQQQGCSPFTFGNVGESCANSTVFFFFIDYLGRNSTTRCKQFLSCVGGTCQPGW